MPAEALGALLARWVPPVRLVANAVIYLHFGAICAGCLCYFPTILGLGSAVAGAAAAFQRVAMFLGFLLAPFALVLFGRRVEGSGTEATKCPRDSKEVSHAPGRHCLTVVAAVLQRKESCGACSCHLVANVGCLMDAGCTTDGGSREGSIGGLMVDIGMLGGSAMLVLVVCPNLVSRLWRTGG